MGRLMAIFSFAILLVGCGYDNFSDNKTELENPSTPNTTIEALRERVSITNKPIVVDKELVIRAVVTANDKGGNFYQLFYLEDESGALEVRAGLYNLYNYYPVGAVLEIELKGLSVGIWRNTLQLGVQSQEESYYPVDYIGYKSLLDKHIKEVGGATIHQPLEVEIGNMKKQMSGRLVKFSNLRLCEGEGQTWAEVLLEEAIGDGARMFEEKGGAKVEVLTSRFATFATEKIPRGSVDIVGILSHYERDDGKIKTTLKMRSIDDCKAN